MSDRAARNNSLIQVAVNSTDHDLSLVGWSKVMNIKIVFLSAMLVNLFSFSAYAVTDEDSLLNLPDTSALKINYSFIVTSRSSRSDTPIQSLIQTIQIDLQGESVEAKRSRHNNKATITLLEELKNFSAIERISCWVEFNADANSDKFIPKNAVLKLAKPETFGTPIERYDEQGSRITISNYGADKSISGSFEDKVGRRLYCNFHTEIAAWYQSDFLSDLKIKHLKALLAPYFDLQY